MNQSSHPLGSAWGFERKMGVEMENFSSEKWVAFVEQTAIANQSESIAKRPKQGCSAHLKNKPFCQRVRQSVAAEAKYQPREGSVRLAKAAFAGARLAGKGGGTSRRISLLFDSFLQPVLRGVRSAGTGTRQMLYRADPFQIDIQVEAKPDSNLIVVTGQLLDLNCPEYTARDVPVLLSDMHGQSAQTMTNGFGEFREEIENTGDLQVTFAPPGGNPIIISLQEVLGPLPEEEM